MEGKKHNYRERTERLGDVKARQMVWVWEKETEGLTDDDLVETISQVTPFGTYLLQVTKGGTK